MATLAESFEEHLTQLSSIFRGGCASRVNALCQYVVIDRVAVLVLLMFQGPRKVLMRH